MRWAKGLLSVCLWVGCGDETETGGAGGAGGGGGSATTPVFALSHLYWGTKSFDGVESWDAWGSYGENIDGLVTTSDFTAHCKPNGGAAPANAFPDGDAGVDNAWGKLVLPILRTASTTKVSDLDDATSAALASEVTLLLDLSNLPNGDGGPIVATSYLGRSPAGTTWHRAPESFVDGVALGSFPASEIAAGAWDSRREDTTLEVPLVIDHSIVVLKIHRPRVWMPLDAAHTAATHGIVSGVLDTEELVAALRDWIGIVDPAFCDGTAVDGILSQIRQGSDIMLDGGQDPNATCNGISIGLGFDAVTGEVDGFAEPYVPPTPCP